jgi:hypothetical protein
MPFGALWVASQIDLISAAWARHQMTQEEAYALAKIAAFGRCFRSLS